MRYLGIGFLGFSMMSTPTADQSPPPTPQQFADAMYGRPPYFSSSEFNWVDGATDNGSNFSLTNPQTLNCVAVMEAIKSRYPGVKIAICFGYNLNSSAAQAALYSLIRYLMSLPSASSIGAIGFETEHTNVVTSQGGGMPAQSVVDTAYLALKQLVESFGLDNIQYYPGGYKGTTTVFDELFWYDAQDTDAYPDSSLLNQRPNDRGIMQGGVSYQPWPDSGCGNGNTGATTFGPKWSLNPYPLGYVDPNCAAIQGCGPCNTEDWSLSYGGFHGTIARALYYDGIVNAEIYRKYCFLNLKHSGTGFGGYAQGIRPVFLTDSVLPAGIQTDFLMWSAAFRERIANWKAANSGIFIDSGGTAPSVKSNSITITVT